ncbi:MAG TPA: hypothetical protein PLX46_05915 [Thiobacillaceae bacterium]|nr:hypothetical protein [Thiobacillaceae bacterium]
MNSRLKPVVVLLGGMMVASLALLATESAWSEAPKKTTVKKKTVKKVTSGPSRAAKPAPEKPVAKADKPAIPASQPAVQPTVQAAPVQQATPVAQPAQEAQAPAPAATNPYLTVAQPNPWKVDVAKAPASDNPYLAYLKAQPAPAPAQAPTPWSIPAMQAPVWTNPFRGFPFQFPFPAYQVPAQVVPAQPVAPAVQAQPAPQPAFVNPYLAYRLPIIPPTPWTPPAIQASQFSAPAWVNPFQPQAQVPAALAPQPPAPALPAFTPPNWANNPYLAYLRPAAPAEKAEPAKPAAVVQAPVIQTPPVQVPAVQPVPAAPQTVPAPALALPSLPSLPPLPWSSAAKPEPKPETKAAADEPGTLGRAWESFKTSVLPSMPPSDQAILPTIKTVYPTGEKPLKVLTFKCPTELVGISPPTTKLLHDAVNFAFDGINKTDLLPFNMQQVCQ